MKALNIACALLGAIGLTVIGVAACTPDPATPPAVVEPAPLPVDGGTIDPASLAAALDTPCEQEDSTNCYWRADLRGNGQGTSFLNVEGHVFPLTEILAD